MFPLVEDFEYNGLADFVSNSEPGLNHSACEYVRMDILDPDKDSENSEERLNNIQSQKRDRVKFVTFVGLV